MIVIHKFHKIFLIFYDHSTSVKKNTKNNTGKQVGTFNFRVHEVRMINKYFSQVWQTGLNFFRSSGQYLRQVSVRGIGDFFDEITLLFGKFFCTPSHKMPLTIFVFDFLCFSNVATHELPSDELTTFMNFKFFFSRLASTKIFHLSDNYHFAAHYGEE